LRRGCVTGECWERVTLSGGEGEEFGSAIWTGWRDGTRIEDRFEKDSRPAAKRGPASEEKETLGTGGQTGGDPIPSGAQKGGKKRGAGELNHSKGALIWRGGASGSAKKKVAQGGREPE